MQAMKMEMVNVKHLANGLLHPDLVGEIFLEDAWRRSHLQLQSHRFPLPRCSLELREARLP